MFNNIEMLNRLTLNSDESVDQELLMHLLEQHNLTSIFRNIARDILKIRMNQICKSEAESSTGILFNIKFDNDDSAIKAKKLIDKKIYKFSDQSFKVSVKHKNNKLKISFIDETVYDD